jgi:U2-associated protein SR140
MACAGIIVYEYELRIGWGKSVSLPAQALPAPPPGQMAVRAKEVECLMSCNARF